MSADRQTQLLADPKEVDVVAIEREIVQLWKDYSGGDSGSSPITRACSLNFIVLTEDENDVNELGTMAGDVTLEHPARIFLVLANRRTSVPKLDAWISARCSLPVPGGKQVCCEQINLTANGAEAIKIPSIVTSLLVSDVPSVLLWKARVNAHDSVLQSLANVADRILIDSSEDAAPEPALLAWQSFMAANDRHTTFGDLAWTHLVAWRSVIANAFNPPHMREQLTAIDAVTIEYSSTTSPRHSGLSQSLLLVSWLANKLDWRILKTLQKVEMGGYTAKLRCGEQTINIRIAQTAARKNFPGSIESVTVHTTIGTTLKFSSSEHRDCVLAARHANGESSEELLNVLTDKSEAILVAQELEVVTRDAGYEAVIKTLTHLFKGG